MRPATVLVVLVACAGPDGPRPTGQSGDRTGQSGDRTGHPVAFVDVSVVGMQSAALATHQTVIVDGGTIVAVGAVERVEVPAAAARVDGRGRFLIPGLYDMHVHLDGTRGMLELFVGSGVTTVRNMAGSPRVIALRDRIAGGELVAPTIYTAGPFVDGARPRWEGSDVVTTAADAERVVAEQAAVGYDFLKIYNGLSLEAYDAIVAAARGRGVRIAGHVPFAVPLEHVLAAEQASIEHLSGYAEAIEGDDSPVRHRLTSTSVIVRWLYADPARISEVAAETARHGVWNCPTLVTAVAYGELWRGHVPATVDLGTVSPDWRARWAPARSPTHPVHAMRAAMEMAHDKTLGTELALVRELAAAGAPLLAGTDTPNPYVVPSASLHAELALFVDAGLAPYTALRAATIDAADFLGDARGGRIAVGAHADLVLLAADPLVDIHALDRIDGVMVRGRWLAAERLRALHDELVASYRVPAWNEPVELGLAAAGARAIQYVIADNGAPVGAYAMARRGGAVVERETLEDETTTVRTTYGADHRVHALAIEVERPEGVADAEHEAGDRIVIGPLTPASALALVQPLVLDFDQRVSLSIVQPDPDVPSLLRRGQLAITRIDDPSETQRAFRLRLVVDRVAWAARLVVDGDGLPRLFRLSWTSRPVTRTWKRR